MHEMPARPALHPVPILDKATPSPEPCAKQRARRNLGKGRHVGPTARCDGGLGPGIGPPPPPAAGDPPPPGVAVSPAPCPPRRGAGAESRRRTTKTLRSATAAEAAGRPAATARPAEARRKGLPSRPRPPHRVWIHSHRAGAHPAPRRSRRSVGRRVTPPAKGEREQRSHRCPEEVAEPRRHASAHLRFALHSRSRDRGPRPRRERLFQDAGHFWTNGLPRRALHG